VGRPVQAATFGIARDVQREDHLRSKLAKLCQWCSGICFTN
jgi:hypothetical protein